MEHHAPLYGLVLAGGKSLRMGQDKGKLEYHGMPQREYVYRMLELHCERTFLSVRSDQLEAIPEPMESLADLDLYKGPFNGLLSAYKAYPHAAWLVMACDLPLMDDITIRLLIEAREPSRTATALATHKTGLPEPLAAIWEPKGLKKAVSYLETTGSSCPRKFLLRSDTALVFPGDDRVLANANDPETFRLIQSELAEQ